MQLIESNAHKFKLRQPTHCKLRSPACACGQASELSPNNILKHFSVKGQISDQLLQLRILFLELF
jgi:hypothetical protein